MFCVNLAHALVYSNEEDVGISVVGIEPQVLDEDVLELEILAYHVAEHHEVLPSFPEQEDGEVVVLCLAYAVLP